MIGEIILEASYRNPTEDTSIPALQGTIGLYRVPLVRGYTGDHWTIQSTIGHWSGGIQGTIGLYRVPLVTGQGVYRGPLDYTEYHWSGGNQGTIGKGLYKEPLLRC